MSRVKVTVLSDASAPSLVLAVLPSLDEVAAWSAANGFETLEAGDGCVQVAVHDWGRPLMSRGGGFGPLPEALAAIGAQAQGVQLLNLGSNVKRLTAEVPVRSSAAGQAARQHV